MNKDYTYCPDCFSNDKEGYKGKRCNWCGALLIKDPLDKLFLGKTQSKWSSVGRNQVLKELEHWLKMNKYPKNNPIRKWVSSQFVQIANHEIDCKKHGVTSKENGECHKCKIEKIVQKASEEESP